MEPTQTYCFTFRSQSVLWSPWTPQDYARAVDAAIQLASSRQELAVEFAPFNFSDAQRLRHRFPGSSGLHIIVWEVSNVVESRDSAEDVDVLSGFKTRCCDETEQDGKEEEVCCVCLDDLYRGSVTTLDCGHEFHPDCIRRWLVRGQNFCPLCKATAIKQPQAISATFVY